MPLISAAIAFAGLSIAAYQVKQANNIQSATVFAMVSEPLKEERARWFDQYIRGQGSSAGTVRIGDDWCPLSSDPYWNEDADVNRSEASELMERAVRMGVPLTGLDARCTFLRDLQLSGAALRGSDFSSAVLNGSDLEYADFRGATQYGPTLLGASQMEEVVLHYADLAHADVTDANLYRAHLERADLTNADMRCAYLVGAKLWQANLFGANLRCANLKGADLRRVRGLTQEKLEAACTATDTKVDEPFVVGVCRCTANNLMQARAPRGKHAKCTASE